MVRMLAIIIAVAFTLASCSSNELPLSVEDLGYGDTMSPEPDTSVGDVGVGKPDDARPQQCNVCRSDCVGLPRQENPRPFAKHSRAEAVEVLTSEQILAITPTNGTFVQTVARPPATMDETGVAFWISDGDLIIDVGIGLPNPVFEDLVVTAVVGNQPAGVQILAKDNVDAEWVSGVSTGVASVPFEGTTNRYAVRIPKPEFVWGEMNTLFLAFRINSTRFKVFNHMVKFTIYAGGFDIPAIPCVQDQGITLPTDTEALFDYGQFEFRIEGKLESVDDEKTGFAVTPGELISADFYAVSNSSRDGIDDIAAVGFFLNGKMVAGPFKYVTHDVRNRPAAKFVSYRDTFQFEAPSLPGVYTLEMMGWYHPDRPEVAFDGSPLGIGLPSFPAVRGRGDSTHFNSGIVLMTVVEE